MIYLNPWSDPSKPEHYDRSGCTVKWSKCKQGAMVKVHDNHYDYVITGRIVSQRVGGSMDLLQRLIDVCIGGEEIESPLEIRARSTFLRQL